MQCVLLGCLFNFALYVFTKHDCEASEFNLQGDYKIGGLFKVHTASDIAAQSSPVALECLTQPFNMEGYSMMQVMRFAVEEINNSSTLLPNISLGYKIFDVCAAVQNFPSILDLISNNGQITVVTNRDNIPHNVIGAVGPYGSGDSVPLAPLFMTDLIPMISYGASSFTLSNKLVYPSFLRTVPTNKDIIGLIIQIIKNFGWNWVAFIGSQDDEYSRNGLELFREYIQDTSICLASLYALKKKSNFEDVLRKIDSLSINVIIVFMLEDYAREVIKAAIKINLKGKVWIAGDTWSMDQQLSTTPGIEKIGTVFGVTDRTLSLPGFTDFVYKSRFKSEADECVNCSSVGETCNQACENCTSLSVEKVINVNPTYSFTIYAAVYTFAHALHVALNCSKVGCSKVQDIPSYLLLQYVRKSNFTLNNRVIRFDENGDPPASFAVVHWRPKRDPFFVMVGTYDTYPTVQFTLNNNLVSWYDNGTVPFSNCSIECETGFARVQNSIHKCCFQCEKCPANTYINTSVDFYTCMHCQEGEWSDEGSTYCTKRAIVYLQYTDLLSILFLLCAASFIVVSITITILFAINYNTPVVKSAGGSMCFLMHQFDEESYQMFQVMRFAVEEINNSTTLLPNVSLGYEIFNHCSDIQNYPSIFSFLSQNGSFPVLRNFNKYQPKVIAITGPYDSTTTITVAPFFMMDLIPMVS
ncbi:hypothetical protein AOLI_G00070840 [Acnodon oligacanthus]